MEDIIGKVISTLIVAAVTSLITLLTKQWLKYKRLTKQEEDAIVKGTITEVLNEQLKPVKEDLSKMKSDIANLQKFETNFSTRLKPTQDEIEHLKDDISEILEGLKKQGIDLNNVKEKQELLAHETRCAWRYRIRQLCHVYLARGYMSYEEFVQLQEMYNIYIAIGGNGQTKELYERTIQQVTIKTDTEIAAIEAQQRGRSCPMTHEEQ